MTDQSDDLTVAYILEQHRYFEDLKQVVTQLAGLLVLTASGAKTAAPDHPVLASAVQLFEGAADGIRRGRPSSGAREHHAHLTQAVNALSCTLTSAQTELAARQPEIEAVLRPLRTAYGHLEQAAKCLPGFEMVDFGRGCCGVRTKRQS